MLPFVPLGHMLKAILSVFPYSSDVSCRSDLCLGHSFIEVSLFWGSFGFVPFELHFVVLVTCDEQVIATARLFFVFRLEYRKMM